MDTTEIKTTKFDKVTALRLLKKGNKTGFLMIYNQYANRVFAVGIKFLQDKELAEKLVENVFLPIWVNYKNFCENDDIEKHILTATKKLVLSELKKM